MTSIELHNWTQKRILNQLFLQAGTENVKDRLLYYSVQDSHGPVVRCPTMKLRTNSWCIQGKWVWTYTLQSTHYQHSIFIKQFPKHYFWHVILKCCLLIKYFTSLCCYKAPFFTNNNELVMLILYFLQETSCSTFYAANNFTNRMTLTMLLK
jgi:hypothetical protein